mgnify:CR=1 FL=1
MKKEVTKSVAKGMKAALDVVLRTEANTASCLIMYQPKAPRRIRNFTSMHYIVFFYWYHHLSLQELLALAWEA